MLDIPGTGGSQQAYCLGNEALAGMLVGSLNPLKNIIRTKLTYICIQGIVFMRIFCKCCFKYIILPFWDTVSFIENHSEKWSLVVSIYQHLLPFCTLWASGEVSTTVCLAIFISNKYNQTLNFSVMPIMFQRLNNENVQICITVKPNYLAVSKFSDFT